MKIFLVLLLTAAGAFAAEMLVGVDGLAKQIGEPSLLLLHVGSKADYEAGHIPGARLVTLADLSVTGEAGLRLELPPAETLRQALLKLDVGDRSRVVIYAGNESIQSATRVWFTFDYLGLEASVLDGGLAAWKAAGLTMERETPVVVMATQLRIEPRPGLLVDADWIAGHLKDSKVVLLDARLPEFYTGANAAQMPRAGHIPGARNVPFSKLLTAEKKFLSASEMKESIGGGETLVAYCHIGQQATVLYFAARLSGKNVKLYDGSFQEWSARTELPVEGK